MRQSMHLIKTLQELAHVLKANYWTNASNIHYKVALPADLISSEQSKLIDQNILI